MIRVIVCSSMLFLFAACGSGPVFDLSKVNNSFDAVSYNNKVDVLWVMDNSGTMKEDRERLSTQIDRMINTMDNKKLDYRMAMVTMDLSNNANPLYADGNFVGNTKVITNETPNKIEVFKEWISVPATQSQLEQGLGAVAKALNPEKLANGNKNFYRQDALLAVVFVSDERDWSAGDWEEYVQFLNTKKDKLENGNSAWVANLIGVINDTDCATSPGSFVRAYRFIEVVEASGGSLNNICNDSLTSAVENINRTIINIITEWKLEAKPVVDTIVVKMNGVVIAEDTVNGWTYNADKNTVVFHGSAIPASDTKVEVDFKPESLD